MISHFSQQYYFSSFFACNKKVNQIIIVELKNKVKFVSLGEEWLSGLACQLIPSSMLKVAGSNPPTSILKLVFSNYQSVCFGLELTWSFGCIVCTKYCSDN